MISESVVTLKSEVYWAGKWSKPLRAHRIQSHQSTYSDNTSNLLFPRQSLLDFRHITIHLLLLSVDFHGFMVLANPNAPNAWKGSDDWDRFPIVCTHKWHIAGIQIFKCRLQRLYYYISVINVWDWKIGRTFGTLQCSGWLVQYCIIIYQFECMLIEAPTRPMTY